MHEPNALLYDDGTLLALDKPSGMLVHNSAWAGGPRERCLVHVAREVAGAEVWPLHRLDRGTSGVVLFVRSPEVIEPFRVALAAGQKRYIAAVRGRDLAPRTVIKALANEAGNARPAATDVETLACATVDRVSLVQARLWSGRTHQVRRHLNHAHHPVLGDANHGDSRFNRGFRRVWGVGRLQLHAAVVALRHPDDGRTVCIRTPPEAELLDLWRTLVGAAALDAALTQAMAPVESSMWSAHEAARPTAWLNAG
ncbi:MAG: hypothetical protein RIT45_861 [Pseudomonadota bacterium]